MPFAYESDLDIARVDRHMRELGALWGGDLRARFVWWHEAVALPICQSCGTVMVGYHLSEIRHCLRGAALAAWQADPTGRLLASQPATTDEALIGICGGCTAILSADDIQRVIRAVFAAIDAAMGPGAA